MFAEQLLIVKQLKIEFAKQKCKGKILENLGFSCLFSLSGIYLHLCWKLTNDWKSTERILLMWRNASEGSVLLKTNCG